MHRRQFLIATTVCAGGAFAGAARACVAGVETYPLLRLDAASNRWQPFRFLPAAPSSARRLRLLGPQFSASSTVQAFELDLWVDARSSQALRHQVWTHRTGRDHGNSGPSSVLLSSKGISLELRLRHTKGAPSQQLRLQGLQLPEGDYALLLGGEPPLAGLACGARACGSLPDAHDALHLQVVAEHAEPELCLRADLACLAQSAAAVPV